MRRRVIGGVCVVRGVAEPFLPRGSPLFRFGSRADECQSGWSFSGQPAWWNLPKTPEKSHLLVGDFAIWFGHEKCLCIRSRTDHASVMLLPSAPSR